MNPEAVTWDAVIVGTGMGGATLGYALAQAGWRILFVERGCDLRAPANDRICDRYVEDQPGFSHLSAAARERHFARSGRSMDSVRDGASTAGADQTYRPYIGCGTGGSSALYGMVLERFFPADFAGGLSNGTAGSVQGARWPIAYEELRPWYDAAERLYRVRGGPDPLRPTEAGALLPAFDFSREGAVVFSTLVQQGMHPYRVHVACEARDGCRTCQGYLCAAECKNDAARMCLSPAVNAYGASLLTECVALTLEAGPASVKYLVCSWRGQRLVLRAKTYVLAAGALLTPAVLLNSKSVSWPNGLANHSGLVGRNLMRHAIDLYVLTRAPQLPAGAPTKELAFNDFCGSQKLGTVQSFGVAMPLGYLQNRPGLNLWRLLGPAAPWLWRRHARQPILGAILEDSPSIENRVEPRGEPDAAGRYRLSLRYRLHACDLARRRRFRLALAKVLAPFKPVRVRGTTDRPALGHVCGTCRFGVDPQTSVLDPCNRAHGLSNLYIVDGSFFPTSGGMNPALTIAANALRVAYHLNGR